jgi:hypothetical protein
VSHGVFASLLDRLIMWEGGWKYWLQLEPMHVTAKLSIFMGWSFQERARIAQSV